MRQRLISAAFGRLILGLIFELAAGLGGAAVARAETCDLAAGPCRDGGSSTERSATSPASPSSSSSFRLNPSAVPVERGLGVEAIYYRGMPDLGLVKGLGRVGAGLSPSNGEETFFGGPGFETSTDILKRKKAGDKYESQKYAAAAALTLWKNHGRGLKRLQLNLGVMGKYNRLTETAWPGAGLSGIAGPFTFGYAAAADETLIDYSSSGFARKDKMRFGTQTISAGVYLGSFAVDYSILNVYPEGGDAIATTLITASLLLPHWIVSYASREENSTRPAYDFDKQQLVTQQIKNDAFVAVQYAPLVNLMAGVFYNYYLLREISFGATLIF